MLKPSQPVTSCDQFSHLLFRQRERKSIRKAIGISSDGLVKGLRLNPIQLRQVSIQHDLYATHGQNALSQRISRNVKRHRRPSRVTAHHADLHLPAHLSHAQRIAFQKKSPVAA